MATLPTAPAPSAPYVTEHTVGYDTGMIVAMCNATRTCIALDRYLRARGQFMNAWLVALNGLAVLNQRKCLIWTRSPPPLFVGAA